MSPLEKLPEKIQEYLLDEKIAGLPYGCIICGNRPFFIGNIERSDPKRMLVYCLCLKCYKDPESEYIVKKIIDHYETTTKKSSPFRTL